MISSEKWEQLRERMASLGLREDDLEERFVLGSGKGGQKVNKTASCVQLQHAASGMELKCQKDRSQAANRYHARRELCDRIEAHQKGEKSRREQEREKIRRQKRRRSRRSKARMLADKRKVSEKKATRKPPGVERD
jgi:protein subunit release factor B